MIRSRLEPVKKAARTLKAHLEGLLNYFSYPITNAVAEALNSRIQAIKANARGFRSFANYRTPNPLLLRQTRYAASFVNHPTEFHDERSDYGSTDHKSHHFSLITFH